MRRGKGDLKRKRDVRHAAVVAGQAITQEITGKRPRKKKAKAPSANKENIFAFVPAPASRSAVPLSTPATPTSRAAPGAVPSPNATLPRSSTYLQGSSHSQQAPRASSSPTKPGTSSKRTKVRGIVIC